MTLALVLALFAFDGEALVEATGRYVEQHLRAFRPYVAQEQESQRYYDRTGMIRQRRELLADYYVVTPPGRTNPMYEFRQLLQVNGRKRLRNEGDTPAFLAMKGRDLEDEYLRLKHDWSRYDLFSGRGFLSNVALALLAYASAPLRRNCVYRVAGRAGDDYLIEFEETGRATLLHDGYPPHRRPLAAKGRMRVTGEGTIRSIEASITVERENGLTRIRYAVDYGPGPDGAQAPVRRQISVHRPDWKDELVAESVAIYTNFRLVGQDSPALASAAP